MKLPKINFVDEGQTNRLASIVSRPLADVCLRRPRRRVANATNGPEPRFMVIVRHTVAERKYAYDCQSKIGKLVKALDEANAKGWTIVDMKRDRKTIFPWQQ
jgi:hypothetical protein